MPSLGEKPRSLLTALQPQHPQGALGSRSTNQTGVPPKVGRLTKGQCMKPWDPRIILLSPRLKVKAFTLLPLFSAAPEQIQVGNQTWNRLLKLVGEGPAVNGRREGLRSKCYGSLFPSECHCQRVPSRRDVSPPRQLPQGGTSVGERLH